MTQMQGVKKASSNGKLDQAALEALDTTDDGEGDSGRSAATPTEEPTFDATSRIVRWNIMGLDRTVVDDRTVASASFELAFVPRPEHAGSFAMLIETTLASGLDDLRAELGATARSVTTELTGDQRAQGKGRVERE